MSPAPGQLRGRAARLAGLLPSGSGSAARTPFVLLVVLLLAGGLITLLMLNSSLNEGSFKLSKLKKQTQDLTDEEQALQRDVDDSSAPGALAQRARMLGMVPGGNPAFLQPDGTVLGSPTRAHALPLPRPSRPAPSATPSDTPAPSGSTVSGSPAPSGSTAPGSTVSGSPAPQATPGTAATPGAAGTPAPGASPAATPRDGAVPLALTGAPPVPTTTPGR
ncbi:hypothetical protein [Streptomyces tremellae]|uniref:Septum formation initiator n=1 Tax=Streptomyces tremellae TaxID=1124239 RepID=A0ABP7GIQ4_9ACTN